MLIRKIVLENYGLYEGVQEFDLTPKEKYGRERPIILFGGKNGAGKTTLLEAVRLALYGKTALGARVRQIDYDKYLRDRIHRARGDRLPIKHASVTIEFDYVQSTKKAYWLQRHWREKGSHSVEETFSLLEEGRPIDGFDQGIAEAFAREIVPEGLSQLFFFDGEKIRELAEERTGDESLAESIKALLGLDTVERLSADLAIYASRKAAELADADDESKLQELAREANDLGQQLVGVRERMTQLGIEAEDVEAEAEQAETRLLKEGHAFAKERERLKTREQILNTEIERIESELRQACERLYPFSICPNTNARLKNQIEAELEHQRHVQLNQKLQGLAAGLMEHLSAIRNQAVFKKTKAAAHGADLLVNGAHEFLKGAGSQPDDAVDVILNLSQTEADSILVQIDQAEDMVKPTVDRLCRELNSHFQELNQIKQHLAKVPAEDVAKPLMESLGKLHQQLANIRAKQKQQQENEHALTLRIEENTRKQKRICEKVKEDLDVRRKLSRVENTRTALDAYLHRLTERKIDDLRQSVVQCFNRLARKGDVIRDLTIDARTFEVTLYDRHGTAIPKAELSSGEKQIYAIAMLWGLARTSGRPLPVIIDTPLGRLDSDHRLNLCKHYFPKASHQVILLSTDTEVDQPLFKELSPEVSRSYHLQYNPDEERTTANEGYFWRETSNV